MIVGAVQSDDACNPDRMYDLISVVIHCGSGLSRGHYISIVKSHGLWLLFDDDIVDVSIIQLKRFRNFCVPSMSFLLFIDVEEARFCF